MDYHLQMPATTWLFVKGTESIWIERPFGRTIIMAGPASLREQHDFETDQELDAFQQDTAERLAAAGWFLWGFDRDRRGGRDRRAVRREMPDRRQPFRAAPQ
jgi:hypothetical protein